jgi:hypothetical protein
MEMGSYAVTNEIGAPSVLIPPPPKTPMQFTRLLGFVPVIVLLGICGACAVNSRPGFGGVLGAAVPAATSVGVFATKIPFEGPSLVTMVPGGVFGSLVTPAAGRVGVSPAAGAAVRCRARWDTWSIDGKYEVRGGALVLGDGYTVDEVMVEGSPVPFRLDAFDCVDLAELVVTPSGGPAPVSTSSAVNHGGVFGAPAGVPSLVFALPTLLPAASSTMVGDPTLTAVPTATETATAAVGLTLTAVPSPTMTSIAFPGIWRLFVPLVVR